MRYLKPLGATSGDVIGDVFEKRPLPPRTCSEAVSQARVSYRKFREHKQQGLYKKAPYRTIIEFPLPVKASLLNFPADKENDDLIVALDESDWPGGVVQKFRALKPLVDKLLEGYGADFVGMLESDADGVGVWSMSDTTTIANVTNATFSSFARLCAGDFGKKPLQPDHTIMAVNPLWTNSKDIGQPWDRQLKARAVELIEVPQWEVLFCCRLLRTSRGARGLLHRSYPHPWALYALPADDAEVVGPCLLTSQQLPEPSLVTQRLVDSRAEVEEQFKEHLSRRAASRRNWWPGS